VKPFGSFSGDMILQQANMFAAHPPTAGSAHAQRAAMPVIGFLGSTSAQVTVKQLEAFRKGFEAAFANLSQKPDATLLVTDHGRKAHGGETDDAVAGSHR
jgi:hypothetical protein